MTMSQQSRKEYLDRCRERYAALGREGRSRLIDEVVETMEVSRKHAIKLLNREVGSDRRRPGRPPL